ncbi:MAG: peptide deformylase [candidate division Zixibacteria bacterium]|nr:peptide deformylase [candidate division Zixibacteria bacterium]
MSVRPIRFYGDPVLREKSLPVGEVTPDVRRLAEDLIDTMVAAAGLGLAAPQIGETLRLFAVDLSAVGQDNILDRTGSLTDMQNRRIVLINPEIVFQEGEQNGEEGCLSFPDLYDRVTRPQIVRVTALDVDGQVVEIEGSGLLARALAHETDHLDGILFIDRMSSFRLRFIQGRLRKLRKNTEEEMRGD